MLVASIVIKRCLNESVKNFLSYSLQNLVAKIKNHTYLKHAFF